MIEIIQELFAIPDNVVVGIGPLAIAGAALQLGQGIFGAVRAGRREKRIEREVFDLERSLRGLEQNRQEIIDPSDVLEDRSGQITNPFANLQVATAAAEFQAEEADLSLAGTLDTLRATGAGAGGATALAQAALRSKRGISANIQQQQAQNQRLRAGGEAEAQRARLAEGARVQAGQMAGAQFEFGVREQRETARLDRAAGLLDDAVNRQRQASQDKFAALGSMFGTLGGSLMGMGMAQAQNQAMVDAAREAAKAQGRFMPPSGFTQPSSSASFGSFIPQASFEGLSYGSTPTMGSFGLGVQPGG